MTVSMLELAQARQIVGTLLEQLGLDAYLFDVEPREASWEVRVDCATAEGWHSISFEIPKAQLTALSNDAAGRERLLQTWREKLADCSRSPS